MIPLYYFFLLIKLVYFYSLVRAMIKFEPMKDHVLFLGVIYTLGAAFLGFVFNTGTGAVMGDYWWEWVVETLILSTIYFWLLAKFDEGVIFWTLLLLGFFLVKF